MKRAISGGLRLAIMALGVAGCDGAREEPEAASETAAAPSAGTSVGPGGTEPWVDPEAPAGISVSDGRLTLPAVSGNPGAVYFTIRNAGEADQAIRSAWVSGAAMAILHETRTQGGTARMRDAGEVPLPAGGSVTFAPGGLHVMAMDIGGTLEEGGTTEVTLTFATGDKVSFPVEVRRPGNAGGNATGGAGDE